MFNPKNDNETDFCESYKSQLLGAEEEEETQSLFGTIVKLLTIFILLAAIIGISLYGYHYFITKNEIKSPPLSMQTSEEFVSDEDLVVKLEEPKVEQIKSTIKQEEDIDQVANAIKIEISKTEMKEEEAKSAKNSKEEINLSQEEKSLEVPTSSAPEAQYLEDLAKLSREIDKERKN